MWNIIRRVNSYIYSSFLEQNHTGREKGQSVWTCVCTCVACNKTSEDRRTELRLCHHAINHCHAYLQFLQIINKTGPRWRVTWPHLLFELFKLQLCKNERTAGFFLTDAKRPKRSDSSDTFKYRVFKDFMERFEGSLKWFYLPFSGLEDLGRAINDLIV